MEKLTVVLENEVGLHARPASMFIKELNARYIIQKTSKKDMEAIVDEILMMSTAEEIKNYII